MADLRSAYIEWILNGRQGPRPGSPAPSAPMGEPYGGEGPVDPMKALVPQGPRSMVPAASEAAEMPIWAGMEGALPMAGAAAAMLHSPELNAGEDKALEDMGHGPLQTEMVKPGIQDSVGMPVAPGAKDMEELMAIQPKTLTRPAGSLSPSDKMKSSVNRVKVSDQADEARSKIKSVEDLRVLSRELQRKKLQQEMGQ